MDITTGHIMFGSGAAAEGCQHDSWVLHYNLKGNVCFQHPEGDFCVTAGNVLVIEPGVHVSWIVPQGSSWEPVWFVFSPSETLHQLLQLPLLRTGFRSVTLGNSTIKRRVTRALLKSHRLATGPVRLRKELALNAMVEALLWCQEEVGAITPPLDARVEAALRYLHDNLKNQIQVQDVVKACQTSRARLLMLFRQEAGVPLMRYLEQERIKRAEQLLSTGLLSIKYVAAEVGYRDPKYFSRRFKRVTGRCPSTVIPSTGIDNVS